MARIDGLDVPHSMSDRYGEQTDTAPDALNRLSLPRQFRAEDAGAVHVCFANPEAMRFWNKPVHAKRESFSVLERFSTRSMSLGSARSLITSLSFVANSSIHSPSTKSGK